MFTLKWRLRCWGRKQRIHCCNVFQISQGYKPFLSLSRCFLVSWMSSLDLVPFFFIMDPVSWFDCEPIWELYWAWVQHHRDLCLNMLTKKSLNNFTDPRFWINALYTSSPALWYRVKWQDIYLSTHTLAEYELSQIRAILVGHPVQCNNFKNLFYHLEIANYLLYGTKSLVVMLTSTFYLKYNNFSI